VAVWPGGGTRTPSRVGVPTRAVAVRCRRGAASPTLEHTDTMNTTTASLPPALAARLSLYGARRKAYIARITPLPEAMRTRMAQSVETELREAEDDFRAHPEPVARLRAALVFWTNSYEREQDADLILWARRCMRVFKQATDMLDRGEHAEAFRTVAGMIDHPELYGPVPEPLVIRGACWLDLPPDLLPPGHTFFDEPSEP